MEPFRQPWKSQNYVDMRQNSETLALASKVLTTAAGKNIQATKLL